MLHLLPLSPPNSERSLYEKRGGDNFRERESIVTSGEGKKKVGVVGVGGPGDAHTFSAGFAQWREAGGAERVIAQPLSERELRVSCCGESGHDALFFKGGVTFSGCEPLKRLAEIPSATAYTYVYIHVCYMYIYIYVYEYI